MYLGEEQFNSVITSTKIGKIKVEIKNNIEKGQSEIKNPITEMNNTLVGIDRLESSGSNHGFGR